ncbi:MAG: YlxR family protein [Firmicutes bacterium]|nr:YlxR family protein [Bacillota bacterium]
MAGKRKIPLRICVGCRTKKPKQELIRLVRTPQGEVLLDLRGKISGRGAYICRQKACFELALKGKRLEKNLRHPLSEEIIAEITALLQSESERTS